MCKTASWRWVYLERFSLVCKTKTKVIQLSRTSRFLHQASNLPHSLTSYHENSYGLTGKDTDKLLINYTLVTLYKNLSGQVKLKDFLDQRASLNFSFFQAEQYIN